MIQPPSFAKRSVPTPRGWTDPRTGELLLARKIPQSQIDEYMGLLNPVEVKEDMTSWIENEDVTVDEIIEEDNVMPQQLNEAPVNNKSLNDMSKFELQELAEMHGIEFKSWTSKSKLIDLVEDHQIQSS
jgi:hypothetical protein